MKIALLWPDYWPYIRRGTERMVHDIADYLAGRGHTVDIIASKPGPGSVERRGPITIYRLAQMDHPLLRFYTWRHRFDVHGLQVLPFLLRGRYDLVHAFIYTYAPALHLARWLRGTPWVYHVVMIPPSWPRPLDRQLVKLSVNGGAPVRVFSQFCADQVAREYGVSASVVPPTVDLATFRPLGGRDVSRPKILYTADLVQLPKGPHLLAMAFNGVHRARPEAVLQFAGPVGFHPPAVKRLLEHVEPAAREAVEVLGPGCLEQLPRLYAEAAVTALPSLGEPFGMVLTESLACGTPVVGSDSGAIPEIITDRGVGILFRRTEDPAESAQNLSCALLQALDLAREPGIAERCRAHGERWSWDAVGPAFEELQARALGQLAKVAA